MNHKDLYYCAECGILAGQCEHTAQMTGWIEWVDDEDEPFEASGFAS